MRRPECPVTPMPNAIAQLLTIWHFVAFFLRFLFCQQKFDAPGTFVSTFRTKSFDTQKGHSSSHFSPTHRHFRTLIVPPAVWSHLAFFQCNSTSLSSSLITRSSTSICSNSILLSIHTIANVKSSLGKRTGTLGGSMVLFFAFLTASGTSGAFRLGPLSLATPTLHFL